MIHAIGSTNGAARERLHNLAISAETRNILHLHSQLVAVEDPDPKERAWRSNKRGKSWTLSHKIVYIV